MRGLSGVAVGCLAWVALVAGTPTGAQESAAPESPGSAWDKRYDREMYVYGTEPVDFLVQIAPRLRPGRALVLAAGEGRNAVWLAQQGFDVTAVDVSARGLEKARALAARREVSITTVVADLDTFEMGADRWDLVTDFYYHDTALYDRVMRALKPGGFFVLQNFTLDQPATNRFGPKRPAWLVAPNQLTRAFDGWRIRHYEDVVVELDEGMHRGPGAVARLLVEKRPVAARQ